MISAAMITAITRRLNGGHDYLSIAGELNTLTITAPTNSTNRQQQITSMLLTRKCRAMNQGVRLDGSGYHEDRRCYQQPHPAGITRGEKT